MWLAYLPKKCWIAYKNCNDFLVVHRFTVVYNNYTIKEEHAPVRMIGP